MTFYRNESVKRRRRHEWTLQQDVPPSYIVLRETIAYLPRETVACIEPDMCQQLGFKSGGLRHLRLRAIQKRVYRGSKFYTVDQLKQAIVLECRTATDHDASLVTTADNGNVVCNVS